MVNPRDNSMPLSHWYSQPSTYIQSPPAYYFPYPQYNPYLTYPPTVSPLPTHPHLSHYIYYPPPIQSITVPAQPIIQPSPEPGVLAEAESKFPPLPSINNPPSAPNEETNNPDKLSHKKENGIYKCKKCERTYLSYPALYTHNKLKHPTPQLTSSTKTTNRGRPKKNVKHF